MKKLRSVDEIGQFSLTAKLLNSSQFDSFQNHKRNKKLKRMQFRRTLFKLEGVGGVYKQRIDSGCGTVYEKC
jgi:hypothetical protein